MSILRQRGMLIVRTRLISRASAFIALLSVTMSMVAPVACEIACDLGQAGTPPCHGDSVTHVSAADDECGHLTAGGPMSMQTMQGEPLTRDTAIVAPRGGVLPVVVAGGIRAGHGPPGAAPSHHLVVSSILRI